MIAYPRAQFACIIERHIDERSQAFDTLEKIDPMILPWDVQCVIQGNKENLFCTLLSHTYLAKWPSDRTWCLDRSTKGVVKKGCMWRFCVCIYTMSSV